MEAGKKKDIHHLCASLTQILYEGAPKKKVSADVFYENIKVAAYLSICNTLLHVNQMMNETRDQGITLDELQGEVHVNLKRNWDELSRTKMGIGAFYKMNIDDIIKAKEPGELIKKSAVTRGP